MQLPHISQQQGMTRYISRNNSEHILPRSPLYSHKNIWLNNNRRQRTISILLPSYIEESAFAISVLRTQDISSSEGANASQYRCGRT
jgi:hypothetical protein